MCTGYANETSQKRKYKCTKNTSENISACLLQIKIQSVTLYPLKQYNVYINVYEIL